MFSIFSLVSFAEASALLAWSWLIYPHWDAVVITGAAGNLVDLLGALRCCHMRLECPEVLESSGFPAAETPSRPLRIVASGSRSMKRGGDPVDDWLEELRETDSEHEAA